MKRRRTFAFLGFAAVAVLALAARYVPDLPDRDTLSIPEDGEEFVYEVSWTWFKLGTIRLKTLPGHRAEAHIDSYAGLPFVDLHSVHYTWMDSLCLSRGSLSLEKRKGEWWGLDYIYDLRSRRVIVEEIFLKEPGARPHSRTSKDTLVLPAEAFVDGLSIAYFPRRFVHTASTVEVPTILYGKLGQTTFRFNGEPTTETLEVLDEPVRVVEIEGNTTVEGIFGMTGDFRGWFSDDEAAVPLKGKLKVLLGNVTVELIKWNRRNWSPPQ